MTKAKATHDDDEVMLTAVEDDDQTPAVLASWGLSGEPITWAPVAMQPVVSVIRATNSGFGSQEFVQMALDAAYPDAGYLAADVCLAHPPTGDCTVSVLLDTTVRVAVDEDLELLGADQVTWLFGDGGTGRGKVTTHTYAAVGAEPAEYTITCEEFVAGVRTVGSVDLVLEVPTDPGEGIDSKAKAKGS